MTPRLTTDYAKNYCNWTLIVIVIVENVVKFFLGHGVVLASVAPYDGNELSERVGLC